MAYMNVLHLNTMIINLAFFSKFEYSTCSLVNRELKHIDYFNDLCSEETSILISIKVK